MINEIFNLETGSLKLGLVTCVAVRVQLSTDLGMGISILASSMFLPMVCLGPRVMSSLPEPPTPDEKVS